MKGLDLEVSNFFSVWSNIRSTRSYRGLKGQKLEKLWFQVWALPDSLACPIYVHVKEDEKLAGRKDLPTSYVVPDGLTGPSQKWYGNLLTFTLNRQARPVYAKILGRGV